MFWRLYSMASRCVSRLATQQDASMWIAGPQKKTEGGQHFLPKTITKRIDRAEKCITAGGSRGVGRADYFY